MIHIYTNQPDIANDIADEARLFFSAPEVAFLDSEMCSCGDDPYLSVIFHAGEEWRADAVCRCDGHESQYSITSEKYNGTKLAVKRHKKWLMKIAAFRALKSLVPPAHIPWGSLTGIRPTRLMRELLMEMPEEDAYRFMLDDFDVEPEKLSLVNHILETQRETMSSQTEQDVDIYIGIPFCKTRCLYCSFASEVRTNKTDMVSYLAALKADIAHGANMVRSTGLKVRSIYVGGGTPTVLTADELEDLLSIALELYGGFGREFTVEAGRPDTITPEKLRAMKRLGVGRISINPQTMNQRTLDLIGRSHTPDEIKHAYRQACEIGFDSINMDMIVGLPGENIDDVKNTLDEITKLAPQNLTVHTLAVKRSSRLHEKIAEYSMADALAADAMVTLGRHAAETMGMNPYYMYRQKYMRGNLENVGYALPGKECIYNIDMMEETTNILAHGAGAISKRIFGGERRVERIPNPKNIAVYIQKAEDLFKAQDLLYLDR